MIFEKKATVAALKNAYKNGYEVHIEGDRLHIYTATWSAQVETRQVPVDVSQTIVEHMGYLPTRPERVRKNEDAQLVMPDITGWREEYIQRQRDSSVSMARLPIVFKEHWQLFRGGGGGVYAFDTALVSIVDPELCDAVRISANGMGLWFSGDELVMIAPGKFDEKDREKLSAIAKLYEHQDYLVDEPENVSMFDDMEEGEEQ